MAPEQVIGNAGAIGPATDIYALGALLYEMLTGRPPFRGETAAETERQVIHEEPVSPARLNTTVPRDLETICLKCLNKEPARRYASAAALADDLRRFGEGRPILARPVGLIERFWRWCRRNPTEAALVATALALVGLGRGRRVLAGTTAGRSGRGDRHGGRGDSRTAAAAVLAQAADLEKQGRWPEARAVLEAAPRLRGHAGPGGSPRARVGQALADVRIGDRAGGDPASPDRSRRSHSGHRLYAEAFREYGIALPATKPEAAAAQIRNSAIRETLLAFLHDWLFFLGSDADKEQFARRARPGGRR